MGWKKGIGACGLAIALGVAAPPAFADPGVTGAWSPVEDYPVVPVSAGVMPDGKIVAWDQANSAPWQDHVSHRGAAMVLDPASGAVGRSANLAPVSLYCSLITSLPDGRLAAIGGGVDHATGSEKIQVYDEDSHAFSALGELQRTRWYPGGTLDAQGNPIVAGGTSTGIERVNAATGSTKLLESSLFPATYYPDLIRTPSGNFVIEDVGDFDGVPAGRYQLSGGTLTAITDTTLLQPRLRGVRTMIGPYRMLWTSGGTSTESMIIDASGIAPTYTAAASSTFPHMTGEAVTLPTGDVLAVGGNSDGNAFIGTPVLTPEIYDAAANIWTSMAAMSRQRQYHSVAALLPDGRVWSAGTSWEDAQEANGQYFSPPYLFRHDGSGELATRPSAIDAPSSVTAGENFSIATEDPPGIRSAALVRLAATTHQVNAGQAYVPLSVTPTAGRVLMTAPGGSEAPPGYYMVFLIDRDGVPSVAPIVRIAAAPAPAPAEAAAAPSQAEKTSRKLLRKAQGTRTCARKKVKARAGAASKKCRKRQGSR